MNLTGLLRYITKNFSRTMKKLFYAIALLLIVNNGFSQTIPVDSLYLGQKLPGDSPKIFKLEVTKGLVAAERITISSDNKEIYYGELNSWPATIQRIKCYKYIDNKWQGPFVVFEGYVAPSISQDDNTMYMQKNINNNSNACTFYSVRKGNGWTEPKRLLSTKLSTHYFQQADLNNYYTASVLPGTASDNSDLCKVVITNTDTTLQSLGMPINTSAIENDFYIARNESYIIFCRFNNGTASDLYISYKKSNGEWTNPLGLGAEINTPNPNWECCPFVTKDGKYLFFMRGGNEMSSYFIYWVSIDKLIGSLRNTCI